MNALNAITHHGVQLGKQYGFDNDLLEARDAVQELVKAARRSLPELANKTYSSTDDMGAYYALLLALNKFGGVE